MSAECFSKLELNLTEWEQSMALDMELSGFGQDWVFRGQAKDWSLEPSLRRARQAAGYSDCLDPERRVITHFRERAHLLDPLLAEDVGNLEWAARIQHYGGPTRLLDFVSSFWVAAFFAMELNSSGNLPDKPVVWAVNGRKLYQAAKRKLCTMDRWPEVADEMTHDAHAFDDSYHSDRMRAARWVCGQSIWGDARQPRPERWQLPMVLHVESGRTDERIVAQGGCFICPLDADRPFEDCLFGTFPELTRLGEPEDYEPGRGMLERCVIVKVCLPSGPRKALEVLERMNITAAALFPGMHGLARSQHNNLIR